MIEAGALPTASGPVAPMSSASGRSDARASLGTLTMVDGIVLLIVVSMMLLCISAVSAPFVGPRTSVLAGVIPLGLWLLVDAARRRDVLARVAVLLVLWTLITSAASNAPGASLLGSIGAHQSALIVIGAIAALAIGQCASESAHDLFGWTVVVCAAISGLVALVQVVVAPEFGLLALNDNRPGGLAGHSAYFGAHMAAAASWFAYRLAKRGGGVVDCACFGAFVGLAALCGSRLGVAVPIGVAALVIWHRRQRSVVAGLAAALVSAVLLATLLSSVTSHEGSAGARLTQSGSIADRLTMWRYGLSAWSERPLLGWGSGRFFTAAQHHVEDDWAFRTAWTDAHNLFVDVLVAEGVIGLGLVLGLIILVVRRARGPLAWMAAAVAIGWLFEPNPPPTFGLALVLAGVACGPWNSRAVGVPSKRSRTALALAGCVILAWSLAADLVVHRPDAGAAGPFSGVAIWHRWDPKAARMMENRNSDLTKIGEAEQSPEVRALTLDWSRRAAELDPDSSVYQGGLALRLLQNNDVDGARDTAERALELQPNEIIALQTLHAIGLRVDDGELARDAADRLCRIGPEVCTPNMTAYLEEHAGDG